MEDELCGRHGLMGGVERGVRLRHLTLESWQKPAVFFHFITPAGESNVRHLYPRHPRVSILVSYYVCKKMGTEEEESVIRSATRTIREDSVVPASPHHVIAVRKS